MSTIEQSIEVHVPVGAAYDQWTQFEEFPSFMDGVEEVRQLDPTHVHWVARIAGHTHEWDAEITDQVPDQRIAWRATSGHRNEGVVTFARLDEERTRVTVRMEHEAEGAVEKVGAALGLDERQVRGDLERFRDLIESRGSASGGFRGTVGGRATADPATPAIERDVPADAYQPGAALGDVGEGSAGMASTGSGLGTHGRNPAADIGRVPPGAAPGFGEESAAEALRDEDDTRRGR